MSYTSYDSSHKYVIILYMNIGILQTAYKKSEEYGAFYNVQEIGLGRALAKKGHKVTLYKGVDGSSLSKFDQCSQLAINLLSIKYIGINGMINPALLDPNLDVLIYFCDTQLKVPSIYKWCQKNNIKFYPYIGVIESHSENWAKRFIMRFVAKRNISIYKRCCCFAKTPDIMTTLLSLECNNVSLLPVGLDETVMKSDISAVKPCGRIDSMLFIGRMETEKQPFEMLRIYEKLLEIDSNLKLTMIGNGYLYDSVAEAIDSLIQKYSLPNDQISLIKQVKYDQISNYYLSHSCYINLNKVEILGMSILEAMYYGCPVFALQAPGPDYLLSDGSDITCGYIASNTNDLIKMLKNNIGSNASPEDINAKLLNAYNRVHKHFTWTSIVDKLEL